MKKIVFTLSVLIVSLLAFALTTYAAPNVIDVGSGYEPGVYPQPGEAWFNIVGAEMSGTHTCTLFVTASIGFDNYELWSIEFSMSQWVDNAVIFDSVGQLNRARLVCDGVEYVIEPNYRVVLRVNIDLTYVRETSTETPTDIPTGTPSVTPVATSAVLQTVAAEQRPFVEIGDCQFGIGVGIMWPANENGALIVYSDLEEVDQTVFWLTAAAIDEAHALVEETGHNQLIANGEWFDAETSIDISAYALTTGEIQLVVLDPRNVELGTKKMVCVQRLNGNIERLQDEIVLDS